MNTTPRVDGHSNLRSGTGTNSSISSLDPIVVNILRDDFGFKLKGKRLDTRSAEASGSRDNESGTLSSFDESVSTQESKSVSAPKNEFQSFIDEAKNIK
jgi:hypothetical protein